MSEEKKRVSNSVFAATDWATGVESKNETAKRNDGISTRARCAEMTHRSTTSGHEICGGLGLGWLSATRSGY